MKVHRGGRHHIAVVFVALAALILTLGACQSQAVRLDVPPDQGSPGRVPRYSLIFLIHGDGSYLYHDGEGRSHQADQEALARAVEVAFNNPEAEVFLFHQRQSRSNRDGGRFLLYRFGKLVLSEWYRRGSEGLAAEAALYQTHTLVDPTDRNTLRIFLYFGHQLPEDTVSGYHASRPEDFWSIPDLARGLAGFRRGGPLLDLVVLSTCNNGTPTAVSWLAREALYLVASPADLHLSHLGVNTLHNLERRQGPDPYRLGRELAAESFSELSARVSTIVTVSVFDLQRVVAQLGPAVETLQRRLIRSGGAIPLFYDCSEDPELSWVKNIEGVEVFFKPPRFGPERTKTAHSGLECFGFGRQPGRPGAADRLSN